MSHLAQRRLKFVREVSCIFPEGKGVYDLGWCWDSGLLQGPWGVSMQAAGIYFPIGQEASTYQLSTWYDTARRCFSFAKLMRDFLSISSFSHTLLGGSLCRVDGLEIEALDLQSRGHRHQRGTLVCSE